MPFKIIRNDITRMQVDAIVNTANEQPVYSVGTDMAVYLAAGAERLLEERRKIGVLEEGEVALTPGFDLPAKYIIHAVSPFYQGDEEEAEVKLRSCYRKSLQLAEEKECRSIAFPLIATGSYGYPKEEGMRIALDEINAFLLTRDMMVYLVVFDEMATGLGRKLYPDLEAYIDRHYVEEQEEAEYSEISEERSFCISAPIEKDCYERRVRIPKEGKAIVNAMSEDDYDSFIEVSDSAIKERLTHLSDTFQEYLMYLIKTKGLTNADVYKRALITKQLFSKIKLNPDYHPDKSTAMRLCVGVGLNLDETKDLLARAGYALSPCEKRDVIFSYFIEAGVYDMIEIDIALEEHGVECFIE